MAGTVAAQPVLDAVVVDLFSEESELDGIPKGWKPLKFRPVPVQTAYFVVSEGDNHYVKAVSSAAGTGIYRPVALDIKRTPRLTWRWKVEGVLAKADGRRKSGDDFAARVYVGFLYDPGASGAIERWKYKAAKSRLGAFPPKWALVYVWDNKLPIGTVFDNAYTGKAKMIVVESGAEKAGRWVEEERDVYADFKKIIGEEPPSTDFVAVMTDTDNTRGWAEASYDDIVFRAPQP